MAFVGQTYSVGQVLTAAEMNQIDSNIDLVRTCHIGSSAPAELATGILWIDNTTAGAWELKVYDGATWIELMAIDSTNDLAFFQGNSYKIVTDTTGRALELESTEASASGGPNLVLYRNSASPADDDVGGKIQWRMNNDAAEETVIGEISMDWNDASDGTEDARMVFSVMDAGSLDEAMWIDQNSNLVLSTGRGVFISGVGTGNRLDYYDEGTFSPTLNDATSGGNESSTVETGNYTRIGNSVTVSLLFSNISTAGMAGTMYLQDLPFAGKSGAVYYCSIFTDTVNTGNVGSMAWLPAGATYLNLREIVDNGLDVALAVADFTTGTSDLGLTLTYLTET